MRWPKTDCCARNRAATGGEFSAAEVRNWPTGTFPRCWWPRDGRLWVGYFDRGLDILSGAGGEVQHVENEHVFCVNRIVEDARRGAVAVATANGLVIFDRDGRQKQVLGREAGLIADHVTDVALLRRWHGAGHTGGNHVSRLERRAQPLCLSGAGEQPRLRSRRERR